MTKYNIKIYKDIKVKMRDGINLYTDIYLPCDPEYNTTNNTPILLERTPYDKKALNLMDILLLPRIAGDVLHQRENYIF